MSFTPIDKDLYNALPVSGSSSTKPDGAPANEYRRHDRFYFDDGSVIFVVRLSLSLLSPQPSVDMLLCLSSLGNTKVEGTSYRLHRYLFNLHSITFAQTFLAGLTDPATPVILKNVEKEQFDAFLDVLYRT